MSTFLRDHALANVWCTPEQDRQFIFKPAKVSPAAGARRFVEVMYTALTLPNATDAFYVYQIGGVEPDLLNVLVGVNTWTPLSRICRERNLVVDLYTDNGVQFPRFASYLLISENNTVFVAVKQLTKIVPSLSTNPLYIRFYSNAYFNSVRNTTDGHADSIYSYGLIVASQNDVLDVQTSMAVYAAKVGHTYGFINGYMVNTISIQNASVGDIIEFVYDSTIKAVLDYSINDLDSFDSTLDLKRKYLLADPNFNTTTIEYQDDIDFWVYKDLPSNNKKGLMFHKNAGDAVRMVTHNDYAISVPAVQAYVDNGALFSDLTQVRLRLHVRNSGYDRPLVNEANRIKELYRLPALSRRKAMLGIDSVVSNWRADVLEASNYTKLMRTYSQFITQSQVEAAYGYNAISKLIADTPQTVVQEGGEMAALLPVALQFDSTIYEYSSSGRLQDVIVHSTGSYHVAGSTIPDCAYIEAVTGVGGIHSGSIFNVDNFTLVPGTEYRFYKALKDDFPANQEWVDVTGTNAYTITNGVLTWTLPLLVWDVQIRGDDRFINYVVSLGQYSDIYRFSINADSTVGEAIQQRPVSIPYGEVDLWLDGYPLVYGIDYHIQWPVVTIVNKHYAPEYSTQVSIRVRCRGFCDSDLVFRDRSETGWVNAGLLSYNHRVDIRDDRVMRYVVGGGLRLPSSLHFAEDGTPVVNDALNNLPYSISDIRVGLGDFAVGNTDTMRAASRAVDTVISNYLTEKLPEQTITVPSIGGSKYKLYSPFLAKIIYDLQQDNLDETIYTQEHTDNQIRALLTTYEPLLAVDPCLSTTLNFNIVEIGPFPLNSVITMGLRKRLFLEKVIRIYLNNRVDLSPHITVTGM